MSPLRSNFSTQPTSTQPCRTTTRGGPEGEGSRTALCADAIFKAVATVADCYPGISILGAVIVLVRTLGANLAQRDRAAAGMLFRALADQAEGIEPPTQETIEDEINRCAQLLIERGRERASSP